MRLPDINRIAGVVDLMLENWQISALALLAFTILCIGLFGGFKRFLKLIIALACIGGIAWVAVMAVDLAQKDWHEIVAIAIAWAPTVLFVLIILISVLVGYSRGLRKSLILLTHAACSAVLCLTLYFICIYSPAVDKLILTAVNAVMGGEGSLQNELGVSADCETMRQVLIGLVPNLFGENEIGLLLADNSAYLMTLADMVFRIAFAVVFYLLYLFIVFILYIIYRACYSERKYKRKKNLAFTENKSDCTYKKHPVGGGAVGLVRGVAVGLIALSFIGSVFYIAAGTGEGKLKEYKFGNSDADEIYSIYRSVESYGSQGIFKVLNSIKDPDDAPYYLFAADLIFSGGLQDERNGIDENIKFIKEIGAYTQFARDTFSLLTEYGGDSLQTVINGDDAMQAITDVFADPAFSAKFENLIDNFDSQTYFINFSLSLANSVISNIDEISFAGSISEDNKELLKVMFKEGYLSEVIPDERELRQTIGSSVAVNAQDIPPCISVNKLLTKKDVKIVLNVVLSFLTGGLEQTEGIPDLVKNLLPQIENLSIFSTERSEEMNPVLGRLYCYLDNVYLTDEGEEGIRYSEVKQENISWGKELRSLISTADDLFTLYDNINNGEEDFLHKVLTVFDEQDTNYAQNISLYDSLCDRVADSVLLGKVLASNKITNMLRNALSAVGENIYVPDRIVYENRYDSEGKLVSYGEAFKLLYGLRLLGSEKQLLENILSDEIAITDILDGLADAFGKEDKHGNTLSDYLTNSVLLRSVISDVMIERADGIIAVPSVSLERTAAGATVNLIDATQLKQIFDCLPEIAELIKPLAEEEINAADVVKIIDNQTLNTLLDSGNGVIEGTVANLLINEFGDGGTIVIPVKFNNFENWVSFGAPGELRKLLSAVRTMDLDFEKLIEGDFGSEDMFDVLNDMDSVKISEILNSDVMHYTVSDYLLKSDFGFGDFSVIVPAASKVKLQGDVIESLVAKTELITIFSDLKDFGLNSDLSASDIVTKLVANKHMLTESKIISASVVNFIMCNDDLRSALKLPARFVAAGDRGELENYGAANPWHGELPSLVTALDEIFGISAGEQFEINSDAISDRVNDMLKTMNKPSAVAEGQTRLNVCYASEIVRNEITVELDEALDGVIKPEVIAEAKSNGYYKLSEIQALSDAADILDLDFLNLNSAELTEKVKGEIMNINEVREGYDGKSTLDIIYPSAIIRHMMTDELDKALPDSAADKTTLDGIKDGGVYSKQEFSSLVTAVKALGINTVDEIREYKFTDFNSFKHNLDTIYSSNIIAAVITKSVSDSIYSNSALADHARAYRTDLKVYKQSEIDSLISLLGDGNIDEYNLGAAAAMKQYICPDENGDPKSFIIAATVSKNLLENQGLIIPSQLVSDGLIKAEELVAVTDAYTALNGSESFEGWAVEHDMALPSVADRQAVVASGIMRATMTDHMISLNGELVVAENHVSLETDNNGREIAVVCESQLLAMFNAIEAYSEGTELKLPEFKSMTDVAKFRNNIEPFYECDTTRYSISAVVQFLGASAEQTENAVFISDGAPLQVHREEIEVSSISEVQRILNMYDF